MSDLPEGLRRKEPNQDLTAMVKSLTDKLLVSEDARKKAEAELARAHKLCQSRAADREASEARVKELEAEAIGNTYTQGWVEKAEKERDDARGEVLSLGLKWAELGAQVKVLAAKVKELELAHGLAAGFAKQNEEAYIGWRDRAEAAESQVKVLEGVVRGLGKALEAVRVQMLNSMNDSVAWAGIAADLYKALSTIPAPLREPEGGGA